MKKIIFLSLVFLNMKIFCDVLVSTGVVAYGTKLEPSDNWEVLDNFVSRYWYQTGWQDQRMPINISWVNFDGRGCLKVTSTDTTKAKMGIVTEYFPPEYWNVDKVKLDVYVDCSNTETDLCFKWFRKDDYGWLGGEEKTIYNVSSGTWIECSWQINVPQVISTDVARLYIGMYELGSLVATYYFDNLRLVLKDGTTWFWDSFDKEPIRWCYAGDAYAFDDILGNRIATESAVKWDDENNVDSAYGFLYAKWHKDKDNSANEAKIETQNFYNLTQYTKIRFDVKCSSTNANIKVGFFKDSTWKETSFKKVSNANTWEKLVFDFPSADSSFWSSVKIIILVSNTNEVEAGEIYVKNIEFFKPD